MVRNEKSAYRFEDKVVVITGTARGTETTVPSDS